MVTSLVKGLTHPWILATVPAAALASTVDKEAATTLALAPVAVARLIYAARTSVAEPMSWASWKYPLLSRVQIMVYNAVPLVMLLVCHATAVPPATFM
jgi:hypothetical protein